MQAFFMIVNWKVLCSLLPFSLHIICYDSTSLQIQVSDGGTDHTLWPHHSWKRREILAICNSTSHYFPGRWAWDIRNNHYHIFFYIHDYIGIEHVLVFYIIHYTKIIRGKVSSFIIIHHHQISSHIIVIISSHFYNLSGFIMSYKT